MCHHSERKTVLGIPQFVYRLIERKGVGLWPEGVFEKALLVIYRTQEAGNT